MDRLNNMLDKYLGITKTNFIKNKIVNANDNDRFNDNRCTFCWGPYDEEHLGVRVLTCNHVFGDKCLFRMIQVGNGNSCPICRTQWFRPAWAFLLARCIEVAILRTLNFILLIAWKIQHYAQKLPKIMVAVAAMFLCLYLLSSQFFFWLHIVCRLKNLHQKYPDLKLDETFVYSLQFRLMARVPVAYFFPGFPLIYFYYAETIYVVFRWSTILEFRQFANRKDCFLFWSLFVGTMGMYLYYLPWLLFDFKSQTESKVSL